MKCKECQKDLTSTHKVSYCEECNIEFLKFSFFNSIKSWRESLSNDNFLHFNSEIYLRERFKGEKYTVDNIDDLIEGIKAIISGHLSYFTKEDLIGVMLLHRQYFRAAIDLGDKQYWLWMNEYGVANLLIELVSEIDNNDFVGASIGELEEGYCNLITAISLSRVLINIENVLGGIFKSKEEQLNITQILDRQKQDGVVDAYYEKSKFDADVEKPEHYVIEDENLLIKLKEMKLDFLTLNGRVEEFLKIKYGITSEEIRSVVVLPIKSNELFQEYTFEYQSLQLILINKDNFYEIVKRETGLDRERFEKIVSLFSLQDLNEQPSVNKRVICELKSILLFNDLVIFGAYDLIQNYGIFKAIHHSSHFTFFFIKDYQYDISLMNNEMDEITKHMTSYFVASVADILIKHGYRLPLEKKKSNGKNIYIPRFEIKKIINDDQNILDGKGDIDVLALDEKKKIIFNIEVKYYQPAISSYEMKFKDGKKITTKNTIEKVKNRHKVIESNKKLILDLFDIQNESNAYTVKSLIVTARENFFLTSNDYPYYNWNEFNRAVKANVL